MTKRMEQNDQPESLPPAALPSAAGTGFNLKVFGIGGAGGNAVDYMSSQEMAGIDFMAINTDTRALGGLQLARRMTLGQKLTRGLGTGGDPEMGRAAAQEDVEAIRGWCSGADVICVVAGLGGGTGTGAGPVIAALARETGALVLALVTLPFEFEGTRRQRQAQLGLRDLKAAADCVICLPNQKVFRIIDENTCVPEALKITNELLAQGVRGVWRLLTRTGMINVDFNDLCAVVRGRHEESTLASVDTSGENRSHEIIEALLKHPFLDAGEVLAEADTVLVSLAGGPDLTMVEVNRVMEQVNRQCENAHIIMGAGIHENLAGKLSVTLVASRPKAREERGTTRPGKSAMPGPKDNPDAHEKEIANPAPAQRPASRYLPPAPELNGQQTAELLAGRPEGRRRKGGGLQGQLPLEIISKGRFEKSEPTIHRGED